MEDFLGTAARIAARMGGIWGLVAALVIIFGGAAAIVLFPGVRKYLGLAWVYLRNVKPAETTLNPDGSHKEGTGAPPIPVDKDGKIPLDQKPPDSWV